MISVLAGLLAVLVLLLPLGLAMVSAAKWSGSWRLGAAGFAAVYAIAEVYAFLAARLYGGDSTPAALYLFGAGGLACWAVVWVVHRLVRR